MFENMEPSEILLIGGAFIGLVFGFLGQSSRFCFRQAVGEAFEGKKNGQLRAWLIASALALAGTQYIVFAYEVDLAQSAYLLESLPILSLVAGGVLFGIGMMLARGCAGRQVVLASTGNLRSLIVIITTALFGYMTMRGLLAPVRQQLEGALQFTVDAPDVISSLSGLLGSDAGNIRLIIIGAALVLAGVLVIRTILIGQGGYLTVAGVVVGLLIAGGWFVTGVIGFDEFEPQRLESITFVAPGGNALQFLMIYTGATANFGIMLIGGVIVGAFISALIKRDLLLQGFSQPKEMLRYMLGGALMGTGAVMAIGCSIGQGLSGISTLGFSSIISLSAIVLGARIGHYVMNRQNAAQTKLAAAE